MLRIEKTADLDQDIYKDAVTIREQVFVSEKGIPIEMEMRGENGPCYYVGYVDMNPVVTARVVKEPEKWTIQRMAVIASERHKNYGSSIIATIEEDARQNQVKYIVLHAQDDTKDFYLHLGYQVKGDGFTEVKLPHHILVKELDLKNKNKNAMIAVCDESNKVK